MNLKEYLSNDQIEMCNNIGIIIEENKEYNSEELYELERSLTEYIEENCIKEDFWKIEEELDSIVDILMDLENESNEDNPIELEIVENDHVKLTNGKNGIVIDITNNAYTVEVDEEFKTGNLDEDIMIVAENSIIGRV